jgi:hypothetical protein
MGAKNAAEALDTSFEKGNATKRNKSIAKEKHNIVSLHVDP